MSRYISYCFCLYVSWKHFNIFTILKKSCCNLLNLTVTTFVTLFKLIHRLCAETETSTEWVSQMKHQTGWGTLDSLHRGQGTHSRDPCPPQIYEIESNGSASLLSIYIHMMQHTSTTWLLVLRCYKSTSVLSSKSRAKLTTNVVPLCSASLRFWQTASREKLQITSYPEGSYLFAEMLNDLRPIWTHQPLFCSCRSGRGFESLPRN